MQPYRLLQLLLLQSIESAVQLVELITERLHLCGIGYIREVLIRSPPVHADLLGFVNRANQKSYLNRQQLDIREVDLDVAGHHQALVEDPVENVDESLRTRWAQLVTIGHVSLLD